MTLKKFNSIAEAEGHRDYLDKNNMGKFDIYEYGTNKKVEEE